MKKILALLCAASLCVTALSACGTKSEEAIDGEGAKIYIYQNSGAGTGDGSEAGSNAEAAAKVHDYIMEKTNIDPVVIMPPKGAETEKLNLYFSSGEQIDVFWQDWSPYASKGLIVPINEYLDKYGKHIIERLGKDAFASMTDSDGNIWGIPRYKPIAVYPTYVRRDWLDKYHLSMPTTIDELENVIKTFYENDPAGNGTTIPFITSTKGYRYGFSAGFTGFGYDKWLDESDSKVKPVEISPGYKNMLATLNKWYTKGYMYKESFSTKTSQVQELITQNKVGVIIDWYSRVTLKEYTLRSNFPDANYEIAYIQGPAGKTETYQKGRPYGMLVSKMCKNPENVIKLFDWQVENGDNYLTGYLGIKDEAWKYANDEKTAFEIIETPGQNYYGEYNIAMGPAMESNFATTDESMRVHSAYIATDLYNLDRTVTPLDYDVFYDDSVIDEQIPNKADIERMFSEESVKFIQGVRPLEQFDNFVSELYSIGLDAWIDTYTRLYNESKK